MMVTQALFYERQVRLSFMELMVEHSPKLRRLPTIEDRREFGAALVRIFDRSGGQMKPSRSKSNQENSEFRSQRQNSRTPDS